MEQGSREWLDARCKGIGGSESPALYNKSPWISQYGLWARKTGRLPPGEVAHPVTSPDLYWGHALEDDLRDAYPLVTARRVTAGVTMLQHPKVAILLANTDGTVFDDDRPGPGVYESKAPLRYGGAAKWHGGSVVPIEYVVQIQHYMACTGHEWASAVAFLPNEQQPLQFIDIERDQRFIDDLCERAERWWDVHVVRDVPPEADGAADTSDTIAKLWPEATGDVVPLDSELISVASSLLDVRTQIAALGKRKAELENLLRAAVGPASAGELPDGTRVEVPTIHRKAYAVEASSYRQVRIKGARR